MKSLWAGTAFMLACSSGSTPRHSADAASSPEQALPEVIQSRVTVPERGRIVLTHDVHVTLGGRLEIGPGAVLAFAKGRGLFIEGGASIANGTEAAPVVLRSAASSPLPGDWLGLVFDVSSLFGDSPPSVPSSALEHVVVEHAGGGADRDTAAGISIRGCVMPPDEPVLSAEIVLRHVALRDNAVRGLDDLSECPVHWENLSFGMNGGVSARVDIALADLLGTAPSESVEITGVLRRSLTLPRLPAPYLVVGNIAVGGDGPHPAVLTVPPKTVLRFSPRKGILVGAKFGAGGLVAHGVKFTCGEGRPVPGCWGQVHFLADASADLDGDLFEAGGKWGDVIVPAASNPAALRITRCLFRDNAGPAFGASACARWNDPTLENKSIGQPLCKVGR